MKNALRAGLACLLWTTLAPAPGFGQDTPDELTDREWRCERRTAKSVTALSAGVGECLTDCYRASPDDPLRFCNTFAPDPVTRDCLDRERARAEIRMLRKCAGSDCPDCYFGGDCESFRRYQLDDAEFFASAALETVFCDDSFSSDGLNASEAACQEAVVESGGALLRSIRRCFDRCHGRRQSGSVDQETCRAHNVDASSLDPRAQRCIDRARRRFLGRCSACVDEPECWQGSPVGPLTCNAALGFIESQAYVFEPELFCVDQPVCGDGRISGTESCDYGGYPDGCGESEYCNFECGCEPLPDLCGDGRISGGEQCDPYASPSGCADGFSCRGSCACEPTPDVCGATTPLPPSGGEVTGTTAGASGTAGACFGGAGPERVYTWTPRASGVATIATCGSSFDTVVYLRESCDDPESDLGCNDDGCGLSSEIRPTVAAGTTYFIFVDGYGPFSEGDFRLAVTPPRTPYGSASGAFLVSGRSLLD